MELPESPALPRNAENLFVDNRVSFKGNHKSEEEPKKEAQEKYTIRVLALGLFACTCIFIATLVIAPDRKRQGAASQKYEAATVYSATQKDCIDSDTIIFAFTGMTCSTLSALGQCSTSFCPTCTYAGACDFSCGFCPGDEGSALLAPTPAPGFDFGTTGVDVAASCDDASCTHTVTLVIRTDKYASESSYKLEAVKGSRSSCFSPVIGPEVPWETANKRHVIDITTTACENVVYEFTFLDSYGDGICCEWGQGSLALLVDGNEIYSHNGDFDSSLAHTFEIETCENRDTEIRKATSSTCAELVEANSGYCARQFCPTCQYAGYCDLTCGFCSSSSTPPAASEVDPGSSPSPNQNPRTCADKDAEVSAQTSYTCAQIAQTEPAYCESDFCPTCPYSGYCDLSCGFCS